MENTALILIDIQNDYFPGGALELEGAEEAAENAATLLGEFRKKKIPVIHIRHEALNPEVGFMLRGSQGQKIHSRVEPRNGETSFKKHYPNAFWQTELEPYLRKEKIKHLVIAGMMTHMCVSTTARAAMERGYQTTVVQDACATRALQLNGTDIPAQTVHQTALAELTLFATISSLQEVLAGDETIMA